MGFNLEDSLRKQGFKKLDISCSQKINSSLREPAVRLYSNGKSEFKFIFNRSLVNFAGLRADDRFNLMVSDNQFAFVPDEKGVMILRPQNNSSKALVITNKEAYIKILTRLKDKNKKNFLACVENGVIKLDL